MRQTFLLLALAGCAVASPQPLVKRGPKKIGLYTAGGLSKPKTSSFVAADDSQAESLVDVTSNVESIYYFVDVSIGTPAQSLQLLLDTGSTKTVVWTDACNDVMCNTDKPKFAPNTSSSFHWLNKNATVKYGGGQQYDGRWGTDMVRLGDEEFKDYGFQAITSSNKDGAKISYGSGVLGLSWTVTDGTDPSRSLTQLIAERSDDKRFGVYLDRLDEQSYYKKESMNSELTIVGYDDEKCNGVPKMTDVYLPVGKTVPNWWIKMDGLKFGDKGLALPSDMSKWALVDSGTPGIAMPDTVQREFFAGVPGAHEEKGVWLLPCNASGLNISVTFAGVEYPIYWGDLLRPIDETATECRSMVGATVLDAPDKGPNDNKGKNEGWIFGAAFMKNVYSVFSYEPPQVGFATLKDEFNHRTHRVPRWDGKYPANAPASTAADNKAAANAPDSNTAESPAAASAPVPTNATSAGSSFAANDTKDSGNSPDAKGAAVPSPSAGDAAGDDTAKENASAGSSSAASPAALTPLAITLLLAVFSAAVAL